MTEYTPEKVADLIADTRDHADYMRRVWGDMDSLMLEAADALTAVSAERDLFKREQVRLAARCDEAQAERDTAIATGERILADALKVSAELRQERAKVRGLGFALEGTQTDRDRLRKAITDALVERMNMEADRILRAALDTEGQTDE